MVLSKQRQFVNVLLIAFILSLEVRISSSAARYKRENNGSLFSYCPPSIDENATSLPKTVWWSPPEVHHRLVQSVRRTGLAPGSLFREGRHTVIYEAQGFDGTSATCEIVITIKAVVRMCQKVTPLPPTTMHCSNNNMAHSTCTFSCPSGFRLQGSSSVTCRTSGEWFGTFPICRRSAVPVRQCPNVVPLLPTIMSCTNYNMVHSTCTFSCPGGYGLFGSSTVTCEASGEWSGSLPICGRTAVQQCRDLSPFLPTIMSCTNKNMANSTCTFSCPTGYDLLGSSTVTCEASGEWSGTFPFCRRTALAVQLCLNVTPLLPTIMSCTNYNMIHSTCTFSCPSGYDLLGSSNVTCKTSGEWSGGFPICRRTAVQQCRDLSPFLPTIMSCTNYNMVHSTCTFSCPSGYDLLGSSNVTCETSGEWSGGFPICRRTESLGSLFSRCPPPKVINATALITRVWWSTPAIKQHLVRSLRRIGPPSGSLFREGEHSVIYEAKGFDGTNSTCEVVFTINVPQCQDLAPTRQTFMRCSNNNVISSICTFSCPRGYQLLGSSSVTCESSGVWSEDFPTCTLVVCDRLSRPDHGSMRCSVPHNHQGSWCEFRCFNGYRIIGSSVRTCLLDEWSGTQPICKDLRSPTFTNCPRLIRVNSEDGAASAEVDYRTPTVRDNSNVKLLSGKPSGERFAIGFHAIHYRAEDESGNIADCVFYIHVYDNQPPHFDLCPKSVQAFTTSLSRAVPVTYRIPSAIDNASPTSLTVSRIFGKASGSLFLPGVHAIHYRATDDAGNRAYCNFYIVVKVSPCPPLDEYEHLQMNCSEHLQQLGSWCRFKCSAGFVLSGSAIRLCERTGWSGQQAICIANTTSTPDVNDTTSKPPLTPPNQLATSLSQMEQEEPSSISIEYEYVYYEEQTEATQIEINP